METSAKELEKRVHNAHERYVTSKGQNKSGNKVGKRCSSDRRVSKQENAYTSSVQNSAKKRNRSNNATASKQHVDYEGVVNRTRNASNSSSAAFMHLTKDLENIYKEFEAGEMNELNKLRRLVSHFRGLSRRT